MTVTAAPSSSAIRPIIIDTDPGQDDAIAILVALASPELRVLGITAVAGNVPLPLTEYNARRITALAGHGRDVAVYAGCPRPLMLPLHTAEAVHGPSGLDGATLPEPGRPVEPRHAVEWLIETLRAHRKDPVTLCVLGPMTNIAVALTMAPDCADGIAEIVAMGGAFFRGGNTTPTAEFNIAVDPHAAHIVFTSGLPLTLMPLDVTHQALTTPARLERIRAIGTPVGDAAAGLLAYNDRYDIAKYGDPGGPLHDPCVIAYLLRPDMFTGKSVHVGIETQSPRTLGMTVMDWWNVTGAAPNCQVMHTLDADGFYDLVTERLARL